MYVSMRMCLDIFLYTCLCTRAYAFIMEVYIDKRKKDK